MDHIKRILFGLMCARHFEGFTITMTNGDRFYVASKASVNAALQEPWDDAEVLRVFSDDCRDNYLVISHIASVSKNMFGNVE